MTSTKHKQNSTKSRTSLVIRAFSDLLKIGKTYYKYFITNSLLEQSLPYITSISLSLIVEQASLANFTKLRNIVIWYLVILAAGQLLISYLKPKLKAEAKVLQDKLEMAPNYKASDLAYFDISSGEVRRAYDDVLTNNDVSPSSLSGIWYRLDSIIESCIILLWTVVLFSRLAFSGSSQVHLYLALIALVALIIYIQWYFGQKGDEAFYSLGGVMSSFFAKVGYEGDIISDVNSGKQIRLSRSQDNLLSNMNRRNEQVASRMHGMYKRTVELSVIGRVLVFVLTLAVYLIMLKLLRVNNLSAAFVIPLATAFNELIDMLPDFVVLWTMMLSDLDYLQRYYDFMDLEEDNIVRKDTDSEISGIEVSDLSFSYPESDTLIIEDLSINFEAGKKYAVVGPNGSGKTTFMMLLQGLYKPTKGEINVVLENDEKLIVNELSRKYSALQQDFALYDFTIKENIILDEDFSKENFEKVLDKMQLRKRVEKLEDKSSTYVGKEYDSNGFIPSGGEQQRILLSRLMYQNRPIIIMDEPTSDLDAKMELELYKTLDSFGTNSTMFLVSHRLASCQFCDEILVFDKGEIVQRGSHSDLVEQKGLYQELWQAQEALYR